MSDSERWCSSGAAPVSIVHQQGAHKRCSQYLEEKYRKAYGKIHLALGDFYVCKLMVTLKFTTCIMQAFHRGNNLPSASSGAGLAGGGGSSNRVLLETSREVWARL